MREIADWSEIARDLTDDSELLQPRQLRQSIQGFYLVHINRKFLKLVEARRGGEIGNP
jgi:hypothetical protein